MCQMKMHALLLQGLLDALEGETKFDASMMEKDKKILLENAHNGIILCLDEKVLRQVSKEKTAIRLYTKLEGLYMIKENKMLEVKAFSVGDDGLVARGIHILVLTEEVEGGKSRG